MEVRMINNLKRYITLSIILLLLVCCIIPVWVLADADYANPYLAITALINAMDQKDWKTYAGLYPDTIAADIKAFLNHPGNKTNALGLYNIKSAKLKEYRPVLNSIIANLTRLEEYQEQYREIQAFIVGIDYTVNHEDKYFFNGVNYNLVVLGKEAKGWKIIEVSDAPLPTLNSLGYKFGSMDEKAALEIIKARIKGKIVNKSGKVLENSSSGSGLQQDWSAPLKSIAATAGYAEPNSIRVYLTAKSETTTLDFTTYCKNVLPNEWIASWPSESLKAGAMAVKMYAWYHVVHPKWPSLNADVKDTTADQVYKANSENTATSNAVDSVKTVGMANSDGNLFEAQYLAGTKGEPGDPGSGKVMQWGTKYWADSGNKTYKEMLHYYYDYSPKSTGAITFFTCSTPTTVTVDDDNSGFSSTGTWTVSGSTGYNNGNYRYASAGKSNTATWTLNLPFSGRWNIYAVFRTGSNRATAVIYTISTSDGPKSVSINQYSSTTSLATTDLGTWDFTAGTNKITLDALNSSGGAVVIADAIIAEYQ
jgi:hypothetical protein